MILQAVQHIDGVARQEKSPTASAQSIASARLIHYTRDNRSLRAIGTNRAQRNIFPMHGFGRRIHSEVF